MNKDYFTPFPTTKYLGPKYFCDRKEEVEQLIDNLRSQQSTTLISIRRMGKTGLINHLQQKLKSNWISIYADILETEDMEGFLNTLSSAILQSVPQRNSFGQKIWDFFKSLNISISYDQLSGAPSVNFNVKQQETNKQLKSILKMLDEQAKPVFIAIDEFQQITKYPEKNVDAYLRTIIQQLKNVVFIFAGSQQQIMQDLFSDPRKPFYRSTSFLNLKEIDFNTYRNFIIKKFKENGKVIDKETVEEILHWTRLHTYYVQYICNSVFIKSDKEVDPLLWKREATKILKEQDYMFFTYREILTKPQWKLLKAIAKEGQVNTITSSNFIKNHDLSSSAGVLRSLKTLIKKDLIYKKFDKEGKLSYIVYDTLLHRWLEKLQ